MDTTDKVMNHNILITSAGQRVKLTQIFMESARQLRLDSKVITADLNPKMAPACYLSDQSFSICKCTDESYIQELMRLCEEQQIGIIIPTIDTELPILARNKQILKERGIYVIVSDLDFVSVCRDKRETIKYMNGIGIETPKLLDKYHPTFPMFAKPYDGSLSTNLHIIRSKDELTEEITNDPKLIFMEYIDKKAFKEYTIDMYYGRDHEVKGIVPRERVKIRAGEINKGYTRKNEIISFLFDRMHYLPGVVGCICIQLFYNESNHKIYGIEINPRFGGGYPLSYYAGANYPEYILREFLLGESIDYSDDWNDNTLMLRYDQEVIVYEK